MKEANLLGLALLPPVALLVMFYLWIWGFERLDTIVEFESLISVFLVWFVAWPLGIVGGIIAHELLHGPSFLYIGGAHRESVTLVGFQRETATPYSSCSEPLRAGAYRWAVAMPGVVLGILPTMTGLISAARGP